MHATSASWQPPSSGGKVSRPAAIYGCARVVKQIAVRALAEYAMRGRTPQAVTVAALSAAMPLFLAKLLALLL